MKAAALRWESALLIMLVLEIALFGALNPKFLSVSGLLYGTSDFVQVGLVALPLTLVIIAGGIDVSFGSTVGLAAIVFGIANFFAVPLAGAVLAALATGALCGAFNAAMIRATRLQPLVVTLGSLYLFSGLATVLSGSVGAGGYEGIGGFPETFTALGYAEVAGVPLSLLVFLSVSAVLIAVLHFTRVGRLVFQIGENERAARHSGMPVETVRALTYVLTGLLAAVAGLVLCAYFGSARVDLGTNTLLPAVTAAVLGGASIYGGRGSLIGTVIATFIIGFLQQGLQMSGVPSQISSALSGGLLVAAVALRHGGKVLLDGVDGLRQARAIRASSQTTERTP